MEPERAIANRPRMDGYDMSMAQLDPAVPLEDHRAALAVVQGWFRQAGLSADEARLLVERFNAAIDPYTRPAEAGERVPQEGDAYLRARWGADYGANMALAETAIARLGGAELDHFLRESGLRFDPFVLRTLAEAAKRWSGTNGNKTETTTPRTPGAAPEAG